MMSKIIYLMNAKDYLLKKIRKRMKAQLIIKTLNKLSKRKNYHPLKIK